MTRRGAEGFTLMEVVVALAVLAVALTILLESHYATVRLFTSTEERAMEELAVTQAVTQAEVSILSGEENGKGKLGARFPDYTYEFTSKLMDETENPGLFEVDVTVKSPVFEKKLRYLVYDGTQVDVGN